MSLSNTASNMNSQNNDDSMPPYIYARIADNLPRLGHSLNSRGELGLYVNPYGCPCQTCHDYLADRGYQQPDVNEQQSSTTEHPGLSNISAPDRNTLERQIGVASGSPDRTPPSLPISPSSLIRGISNPLILPTRSDCHGIGGISGPADAPAPGPLPTMSWMPSLTRSDTNYAPPLPTTTWTNLKSSDTNYSPTLSPTDTNMQDQHSGLCHCGPCTGVDEATGMPLHLRKQIDEHLNAYLSILEKQRNVLDAKLALYAELIDDTSPRLRVTHLAKKIQGVKDTMALMQ